MARKPKKEAEPQVIDNENVTDTKPSGVDKPTASLQNANPPIKDKQMAKPHEDANLEEELGSVVEFEDNIADAEAPLPLPVGNYHATIKGAEQKVSSTGRRYAAVTFYVPPEGFPADFPLEEAPDGVTMVFRRLSLENNKAARFMLRRFIENIGAPPVARSLDLTQWIGLEAIIVVKHDTYEGVTRPTIDRVSAAS